jgi:hypothetical protein
MKRYEASGRFGVQVLPAVLVCLAVGVGLAWVYQWLIDLIPFIYVNVLLTVGFGLVLAFLIVTALRKGKNRSRALTFAVAVAVPLVAVAASFWWAYQFALPDLYESLVEEGKRQKAEVVSREEFDGLFTFDDWRQLRVETGWTVGRVTSSSNGPALSGFLVYVMWLIEAGILVGICLFGALFQSQEPYCERCDVWQTAETLGPWMEVDGTTLRRAIREERLDPLLAPVPAPNGSPEHGAFVLSDCPRCGKNPFLDVAVIRLEQNKDGKVETKTEVLAKGIELTCAQRDALKAYAYPEKAESATPEGGAPAPTS